ncbi:MAG: RNA polymerase sigma factor SigJ [Caldilineaceae bacterium]|nr:RNA polymerase sigma factor SigJ [Caldilineaceae bacterium]
MAEATVEADESAFEQYRRLLFAIAYRMVGTAMEAEDIVQETYLRYRSALPARIDNLKAYLTTITTRLCLDYLKAAQTKRQSYVGIWLPEPTVGDEALAETPVMQASAQPIDPAPSPPEVITQQESISMAFLVILEQLTPVERAVLLLRGVFDYDYSEIAMMVGKSEANCRQIFRRAQAQVRAQRPRFDVAPETHTRVVNRFIDAVQGGDLDALLQTLTEDVTFTSDGGGKAVAVLKKLVSPPKVARFFMTLATQGAGLYTAATCQINGQLGVLLYNLDGTLETALSFQVIQDETDPTGGARIGNIYAIRNPDKLARLAQADLK